LPLPATHHCGLVAAVNVGAAGSAAAHHFGISVATIIRASSCRATERLSCTLHPWNTNLALFRVRRSEPVHNMGVQSTPAGGEAEKSLPQDANRRGAGADKEGGGESCEGRLHHVLPGPVEAPQVSNTIGEKSTPIRPQESALSRFFCSPLSFRNVAALPRRGRPVAEFCGQWLGPPRGPASRPVPSAGRPLGVGHSRRCPPRGHVISGHG